MWDDSLPSVDDDSLSFGALETPAKVAWTEGQLVRIENEWHRAQRSFAYHPSIGIAPLRGDPPHEYQLNYHVRTLVMDEVGTLQYVDEVSMHMWLPPGFPNQGPVMRPMAGVFHPNIAWEGVYLSQQWKSTDTLVEFAARVGELLAFRSYDPESVVNGVAMEWLGENGAVLPTDSRADFSPFAGGEPLGRIQQLGPATLEQIRRALDDMRGALIAHEGAPTGPEVDEFARQTRAAASLFLDSDIPDSLRQPAIEFDDWCRELPLSVPQWEYLRRQRAHAEGAEFAVGSLRNAAAALNLALGELQSLASPRASESPTSILKHVPPMNRLQPIQMKLPPLIRDFEKQLDEVRGHLEGLREEKPEIAIEGEGSLGRRLATQARTVAEIVASAKAIAEAALTEVQPLAVRARPELNALEQAVSWREYMDTFSHGRSLEKQVMEWAAPGVHAFFLDNSAGSFGPFQFEEPIDLGGTRVVVRNLQGTQIDVIDAIGHHVLGRGTAGTVSLPIVSGGASRSMSFRLTGRCDDLTIRIDYISKQSVELLNRLTRPVIDATSWCGALSKVLTDPKQQKSIRNSHRTAGLRWRAIMADLAHLLSFKERLATYNLVSRMIEEVPRIRQLIADSQTALDGTTEKIQAIMKKSSRDADTDRMIIPPKLAKAYSDELRTRDQAKHEISRLRGLLKQIARELHFRLSNKKLCGRPEVPAFRAMPPVPDALAQLQDTMSDENIAGWAADLGTQLGVQLELNASSPPAITAARPQQPGGPASVKSRPAAPGLPPQPPKPAGAAIEVPIGPAPEPPAPAEEFAAAAAQEEVQEGQEFGNFVETEYAVDHDEHGEAEPQDDIIADFFGPGTK